MSWAFIRVFSKVTHLQANEDTQVQKQVCTCISYSRGIKQHMTLVKSICGSYQPVQREGETASLCHLLQAALLKSLCFPGSSSRAGGSPVLACETTLHKTVCQCMCVCVSALHGWRGAVREPVGPLFTHMHIQHTLVPIQVQKRATSLLLMM